MNCLFLRRLYARLQFSTVYHGVGQHRRCDCSLSTVLASLVFTHVLSPTDGLDDCAFYRALLRPPHCALRGLCHTLSIVTTRSSFVRRRLCHGSGSMRPQGHAILCCSYAGCCFRVRRPRNDQRCKGDGRRHPGPVVAVKLFVSTSNVPLTFSVCPNGRGRRAALGPLRAGIVRSFNYAQFVCYSSTKLNDQTGQQFGDLGKERCIVTRSLGGVGRRSHRVTLGPRCFQTPNSQRCISVSALSRDGHRMFRAVCCGRVPVSRRRALVMACSPGCGTCRQTVQRDRVRQTRGVLSSPNGGEQKGGPGSPTQFVRGATVYGAKRITGACMCDLSRKQVTRRTRCSKFCTIIAGVSKGPRSVVGVGRQH